MAAEPTPAWRPDVPVPPGATIREILDERGITQADFSVRLDRTEKFVSQLVNGKAPITYETALDLERVLGVPASFWNSAEATYRDLLVRQQRESKAADLTEWARAFPTREMVKHGWIAKEDTPAEQAETLLEFFGVSAPEAHREYWGSRKRLAARMSTSFTPEVPALTAWLRMGERQAEGIRTAPFNEAAFRIALDDLRLATRLGPAAWQTLARSRCAECGVALVFVPDLPKTRCYATSWWASRSRAVIQLGLRGHSSDQAYFSFFHEAMHLLFDDRSSSRMADLNGDTAVEDEMNHRAADFLIPPDEYVEISSLGRPGKAAVLAFAERLGIDPGIVVGRLQREEVIPRSWMNDLKTRLDWAEDA